MDPNITWNDYLMLFWAYKNLCKVTIEFRSATYGFPQIPKDSDEHIQLTLLALAPGGAAGISVVPHLLL